VSTAGPIERMRRILAAPDGPLALAAILTALAMSQVVAEVSAGADQVSTKLLLALCATAPVALVAGQALAAAGMITVANLLTLTGDLAPTLGAVLAQLVAGYRLARTYSRRVSFPFAVPFLGYAVARPDLGSLALLGAVSGAIALGDSRRAHHETLVRAGASRAVADALLEHAARGERARIARELHDVVAHHISLIAVQAETARLTTPGMPPDGARRLAAIGDTARSALTEMRRLLGVLREDAGTEPTRMPQPGLEQLNELIDDARDTVGRSTRLIVRGPVAPLDPGIELTAYRIVQEALTNARRHAPGSAVDVELHYAADSLRLCVRDNGPGPPVDDTDDAGHGLLGMRERAAMVGGTLSAGPGPFGGFRIDVVLPTARAVLCGRSGLWWWTIRRWSAPGSVRCWTPRRTSPWWAPRRTAPRRSGSAASSTRTWC
jgi:signal transduction histidine kinase